MSGDAYLLAAIDSSSEQALSSKHPGNMETNVFFQHAYNYHHGTYADTAIRGNDERSSEYGLDMGDKSAFWINPDVIAIGCSFTQMGDLPYSFNWPKIIEYTQRLKVNNCGQSSSGVNFEIAYAMDVIKNYGTPKKIYALFPNLDRAVLPHKFNKVSNNIELANVDWDSRISGYVARTKHLASRLLFPDSYDEFYVSMHKKRIKQQPPETVVFQSFLLIDMLETMCTAAGIDFRFSTWNPRGIETFKRLKYNSYVHPRDCTELNTSKSPLAKSWEEEISNSKVFTIHNNDFREAGIDRGVRPWEMFGVENCSECEHEPQTELQNKFWLVAADGRHVGFHDQIHFAEHFLQKQISNEDLKKIPELRFSEHH
jgi:hypothetical protein